MTEFIFYVNYRDFAPTNNYITLQPPAYLVIWCSQARQETECDVIRSWPMHGEGGTVDDIATIDKLTLPHCKTRLYAKKLQYSRSTLPQGLFASSEIAGHRFPT